jgi:F-type H+-transporting ATPase subunit delta
MKESSLVKRYAKALVQSVANESEFERITAELNDVLALLAADAKLKTGMATFLISQPEKIKALNIIKDKMNLHPVSFRFLLTIAAENRFAYLEQIVRQLPDAWSNVHGVEKVTIFSAVELTSGQRQRLLTNLEKALQKKIMLNFQLEPALIAGISLQRGSLHYDFSLAGNLKKLRESLVGER